MGRFKDMDIMNNETTKGVLLKTSNIRKDPNPAAEVLAVLDASEEVTIIDREDEKYYKIMFKRGRIGYILKELVKEG